MYNETLGLVNVTVMRKKWKPSMSSECCKTKDFEKSLKEWQTIEPKKRKCLISELGEMAVESVTTDGEFTDACNSAANLLDTINKYPELLNIVIEKHLQTNKE